uniref:Ig-like domain-containing protein n=1 Tax=Oryzias latipes TaxID=8090 RepID=A0A3P9MH25_ORYLA
MKKKRSGTNTCTTSLIPQFGLTSFLNNCHGDIKGMILGQPDCVNGFCISVSDEKITAKSGLCVVIPCSFQTPYNFNLQHLVWFKCESDQRCGDSDMIFHTNKNTNKPLRSGFLGRVSLLDPEVKNKNCSILISDLRESDSGFYHIFLQKYEAISSSSCLPLLTKHVMFPAGSRQKPTVTLPDLTVGHQATLTCTAPALCSKSPPGITWMWRGAAENDPSLTAVTQRHHSTLTFIPTTEHHNSKITCRIQFSNDTTTEKTVNLHVNCKNFPPKFSFFVEDCDASSLPLSLSDVKITGNTDLKEDMTLNLTCTTTSVTPAEIQWIRFGSKTDQLNRTSSGLTLFLFSLFSQIHDGLTVAEDPNCLPEGAENEAVSTGEAAPKLRSGSGDVEYASIDFSLLKRRERTREPQAAATEYAEVKVKKEERHVAGEEEAMVEEDDKTLLCVSKKKDAEEEAVYSSVNDLMDEI